jgi:hypothetical protein
MSVRASLMASTLLLVFAHPVLAQKAGKMEVFQENNLSQGGVIAAWARGLTGTQSIIAILDSGFDLTASDLKGKVLAAKNFNSIVTANTNANKGNFQSNIQTGSDVTWSIHGTEMASIAAGALNGTGTVGVAPDAKLLLAQVGQGLVYSGNKWVNSETGISNPALNSALTWAEKNGAIVANLSLGSSFDATFQKAIKPLSTGVYVAPSNYGSMYGYRANDLAAFASASSNLVIVAAAGNQGLPYAQFPGAFATQVNAAGDLMLGGRVLIVGSVNSKNVISSFSNRAGSICTNISGNVCKDPYQVKDFFVVAPGELQAAALPNQSNPGNVTGYVTGTSPATAYVSGGVAIIHQAWPQLSAAQIVKLITLTATDLGAPGVDEVYGNGLVNIDKATQPYGALKVADYKVKNGSVVASSTALATSALKTNGSISLNSSQVLQTSAMVDELGRNYTVDLRRAQFGAGVSSYFYASPWLALNPLSYHEENAQLTSKSSVRVMSNEQGFALQYDAKVDGNIWSFQFGSMQEKSGFLGNRGSGAFSTGDSATVFGTIGLKLDLFDGFKVAGSYGLGITRSANLADSLLQLSPSLISRTWKLGVAKENLFFDGRSTDQVSVDVSAPVTMLRGRARITSVTGYDTTANEDGSVLSTATVASESVNLKPDVLPLDLILGYSISKSENDKVAVNLIKQFNAGGIAGRSGYGVGLMFKSAF